MPAPHGNTHAAKDGPHRLLVSVSLSNTRESDRLTRVLTALEARGTPATPESVKQFIFAAIDAYAASHTS